MSKILGNFDQSNNFQSKILFLKFLSNSGADDVNNNYITCLFIPKTVHSEPFDYLNCILEKRVKQLKKKFLTFYIESKNLSSNEYHICIGKFRYTPMITSIQELSSKR